MLKKRVNYLYNIQDFYDPIHGRCKDTLNKTEGDLSGVIWDDEFVAAARPIIGAELKELRWDFHQGVVDL